jgi:hypothetical protein
VGRGLAGTPNLLLNIQFIGGGSNQAPVADFTISCQNTASPPTCTLNASPSTDDAGFGNLTFGWANNIGRPAKTGNTATYNRVADPTRNTFDVTLTATDAGGLMHQVTRQVVIPAPASSNQPPVANFTIACQNTASPPSCTLNASPSTDDAGFANLTFGWANNIGRPAKTGNTATYTRVADPTRNTFDVTLTATDAGGLAHQVTKQVVIPALGANQPPIANFTITCQTATIPHSCTADAGTSTDDGGFGNLTFAWANSVGRPAKTGPLATYTLVANPARNTFDVTLTATDAQGLTHTKTLVMVIP